jgi:hypothetical protein
MSTITDAVRVVDRNLHDLFGPRLKSVVVYSAAEGAEAPTPMLAVIQRLTADDLHACASHVLAWHDSGVATPLLLDELEFGQSLDAFPFEFGAILADHAVVSGVSPFDGLRINPVDLRRACEVQSRSHGLHLREGYLEAHNRSDAIAALISHSAAPLAALLENVLRLEGQAVSSPADAAAHVEASLGLTTGVLSEVVKLAADKPLPPERARALFPAYLDAVQRLTRHIDQWSKR